MQGDSKRCLTKIEYEESLRNIYSLHAENPKGLSGKEIEKRIREAEFYLLIDYKLGKNFSMDRREKLWAAQESLNKKSKKNAIKFLFGKLFGKNYANKLQDGLDEALDEFKKLLTEDELKAFFDLDDDKEKLILPLDIERLK